MDRQPAIATRRLAAILAADAAHFSRLVAQDEERTLQVLTGHRAVIDGIIALHGGRIVTTAGDSVLAEFSSPVQAVRAAIEIQHALRLRNAESGLSAPMLFRIGINLGDVVVDGNNVLGDCVNVAVRLENLAAPGAICIAASVRDHVTGKLQARFQDLGTQFLKNIPRPVRAYLVLADTSAGEAGSRDARRKGWRRAYGTAVAAGALGLVAWYTLGPEARLSDAARMHDARGTASGPEQAFWESVRRSDNPAELQAYLDRYSEGTYAGLARARMEGLLAAQQRRSAEEEASTKASEAQRAQVEALRLQAQAEAAVGRAAAEQATAARLKTEAEAAGERAAAAARAAADAQQRVARSNAAPAAAEQVLLLRAASPLDGRWSADWACEASANQPATSIHLSAQILYREIRIESGQVGLPGYFRAYGSIGDDGVFKLQGTHLPRTQRIVGNEEGLLFAGKLDGERLEGSGAIGKRRCSLALSRTGS